MAAAWPKLPDHGKAAILASAKASQGMISNILVGDNLDKRTYRTDGNKRTRGLSIATHLSIVFYPSLSLSWYDLQDDRPRG
jgi:hypothetical protein